MSYPALPARRMPWDDDGTVVAYGSMEEGILGYPNGSQAIFANGVNETAGSWSSSAPNWNVATACHAAVWAFFPEQRDVSAYYLNFDRFDTAHAFGWNPNSTTYVIEGSNDTTNGIDGSWETASLGGQPAWSSCFSWRSGIQTISFTGAKATVRIRWSTADSNTGSRPYGLIQLHLYGAKHAGQTPDDILYLDGLNSYAEFTAPEDFGDMPLGTTATRTFKVKNSSGTHTANSVNLQCNDADFIISQDNSTWVTSFTLSSLAAGASSAVLYVRDTAPNAGNPLRPRFARIVVTVGSWT